MFLICVLAVAFVVTLIPVSAQTTSCVQIDKNIKKGDKGDAVIQLQLFLVSRGYAYLLDPDSPGGSAVTGQFGALTEKAVKDFQEQIFISPASGEVGPITRAQIAKVSGCETVIIGDLQTGNKELEITNPDEAATWKRGQNVTIGYKGKNLGTSTLLFTLRSATSSTRFILAEPMIASNSGSLKIKVPLIIPDGSYNLVVGGRLKNGVSINYQAPFLVQILDGNDKKLREKYPTISITNPTASTIWSKNENQTVEWTHDGGKKLKFNLVLHNTVTTQKYVIKDNVPNNGKAQVSKKMLKGVPEGIYQIKLRDRIATSSFVVNSFSEPFKIVGKNSTATKTPVISSIKPKQGQNIKFGERVVIKGKNFGTLNEILFNDATHPMFGTTVEGVPSKSNGKELVFTMPSKFCMGPVSENNCTQASGTYGVWVSSASTGVIGGDSAVKNFEIRGNSSEENDPDSITNVTASDTVLNKSQKSNGGEREYSVTWSTAGFGDVKAKVKLIHNSETYLLGTVNNVEKGRLEFTSKTLRDKNVPVGTYHINVSATTKDDQLVIGNSPLNAITVTKDDDNGGGGDGDTASITDVKIKNEAGNVVTTLNKSGNKIYTVKWDTTGLKNRWGSIKLITGGTSYDLKQIEDISAGIATFSNSKLDLIPNSYYTLRVSSIDTDLNLVKGELTVQVRNSNEETSNIPQEGLPTDTSDSDTDASRVFHITSAGSPWSKEGDRTHRINYTTTYNLKDVPITVYLNNSANTQTIVTLKTIPDGSQGWVNVTASLLREKGVPVGNYRVSLAGHKAPFIFFNDSEPVTINR